MFKTIILHVPHSSADFSFAGEEAQKSFSRYWQEKARDIIDWYTDELFVPEIIDGRIIPVVFDTCRTVCDVERMSHDPLADQGLGITSHSLLGAYDPRLSDDGDIKIMQKYLDHQYRVASLLVQNHNSLLLDCHSFSNHPTPLQRDAAELSGIDICIGFNDDFTRPDDTDISAVKEWFLGRGYKVGINKPFSNSKTVDTPAEYKTFMIEVNKSLYMDETSLEKTAGFERLRKDIQDLYSVLLE